MQGAFFRGTTHSQDGRFSDKEKKLMQTMKFDEILDKKVNLNKVDLGVIEPWVDEQVTNILGMEDEVIPAMIINELDTYKKEEKAPNGKLIQIRVTGFLERDAKTFMVNLWKLLLEAEQSEHGIPHSLIAAKRNVLKVKEEELKKIEDQRKRLEEAQNKLKEDEEKIKQLKRIFDKTDQSEQEDTNISTQKMKEIQQEHRKQNTFIEDIVENKAISNNNKEDNGKDERKKEKEEKGKKRDRKDDERNRRDRSRDRRDKSKDRRDRSRDRKDKSRDRKDGKKHSSKHSNKHRRRDDSSSASSASPEKSNRRQR